MKEHPILFNSEMVRAVLEGRKTQTRRVIKPQPYFTHGHWRIKYHEGEQEVFDGPFQPEEQSKVAYGLWAARSGCPYGQPGGRLWVRETFCIGAVVGDDNDEWYVSQCTGENDVIPKEYCISEDIGIEEVIWKPSIFMPRTASRIALEITNVRVERVQEISLQDKWDEGYPPEIGAFKDLWDSINEKRGFGWDINPWVWVVEFKRI